MRSMGGMVCSMGGMVCSMGGMVCSRECGMGVVGCVVGCAVWV